MTKQNLTKWIIASAAVTAALACQPKTDTKLPEAPPAEESRSSCPCHSRHTSLQAPFINDHFVLNEDIPVNTDQEESSTYVIEIDDVEDAEDSFDPPTSDQIVLPLSD